MNVNGTLVMKDFAANDRRSVHAGLRGRDDGRAELYNRYAAATGVNEGEIPWNEVMGAYSEAIRAGVVAVTLRASETAKVVTSGHSRRDVVSSGLIFCVVALGMLWWLAH